MVRGKKVVIITAGAKPVIKKLLTVSTRGLTEHMEENGSKQIDDDKEVTIPVYKGRKVTTTTADTKPARRKLLTALVKRALEKDVRDVSVRKV